MVSSRKCRGSLSLGVLLLFFGLPRARADRNKPAFLSSVEGGELRYDIAIRDPRGVLDGSADALRAQVDGAMAAWGQFIHASGRLGVEVDVDSTTAGRAEGRSAVGEVIGLAGDGSRIVEQGAAYLLRTGVDPNGAAPDILITIDPGYLFHTLWMDPSPRARSAPVPPDRTDAVSVLMHEIAHALGMVGYRNLNNGALRYPGQWIGKFDRLVRISPSGWFFVGRNAMAVYGGKVPLTSTQVSQNVYHLGNGVDGKVADDLMNGIAFRNGTRYWITPLDRAVLRDLGVPVE